MFCKKVLWCLFYLPRTISSYWVNGIALLSKAKSSTDYEVKSLLLSLLQSFIGCFLGYFVLVGEGGGARAYPSCIWMSASCPLLGVVPVHCWPLCVMVYFGTLLKGTVTLLWGCSHLYILPPCQLSRHLPCFVCAGSWPGSQGCSCVLVPGHLAWWGKPREVVVEPLPTTCTGSWTRNPQQTELLRWAYISIPEPTSSSLAY